MLIFDIPISFSALLGYVALTGLVVNNGIILLDYIAKNSKQNILLRCLDSVKLRSRPILISNITTAIGLIPLIILGNDFLTPLSVVMLGGIISSIPTSIIIVPSIYVWIYDKEI